MSKIVRFWVILVGISLLPLWVPSSVRTEVIGVVIVVNFSSMMWFFIVAARRQRQDGQLGKMTNEPSEMEQQRIAEEMIEQHLRRK